MKRTARENIVTAYSLHDMSITSFDVTDNTLVLHSQSGLIQTAPPYEQVDGSVEFNGVRWDFSYVYLFHFHKKDESFTGKKMMLKDFIMNHSVMGFSILDETFGYNLTKFSGLLYADQNHYECIMEIYHEKDMIFITEQ